ncbi:MAG: hypothetical protein V7749_13110 [Cocleimonas sp.]
MIKTNHATLLIALCALVFTATSSAEGFIKKEVYSFKDSSGNTVFTDRQPVKKQTYKIQTIEAANSTGINQNIGEPQNNYKQRVYSENTVSQQQTVRIIVEDGSIIDKKSYKKKRGLKRCKSYKKRFDYYSDKMKSGYKNSEYNKLESNRKKYRKLLFDNCDTRTFSD